MRTRLLVGGGLLVFLAFVACGSDSGSGGAAPDDGGPSSDGSSHADATVPGKDAGHANDASASDGGPVTAPYGLDARPQNKTCLAPKRPPLDTTIALQPLWQDLTFIYPTYIAQAPGANDRFYVLEESGRLRTFKTDALTNADITDVITIPVNASGGEGGLLGMAFHPNWQVNHEVFLSYTRDTVPGDPPAPLSCITGGATAFTSVIARYKSSDNGLTLDANADEILKVPQPYDNHNGGGIQFSPIDGMLTIGFGDGGGGNDPCGSGQDLTSPLGKMLRIDVNAPPGTYKIPSDNPFINHPTALKEIWSWGHRNPWRWSFDAVAGDLWVGDVGQSSWEEIDHVVPGGNYGWNICEGFHLANDLTNLCNVPGLLDPVVEHDRTDARAIVGGYVYRGSAIPNLVGTYIYGDNQTGNIWALTYDQNNKATPVLIGNLPFITTFGVDNQGEIYVMGYLGAVAKIVPAGPPMPDTFPKLLSQTGCVDPQDPTKPAPGMIPYDVQSPLWSDGAQKGRYFAIPDGTSITIGADGDWDLPNGSVATKTFAVGGKNVETRLFMRHDDGGWAGYTYEWNDQGTDAALLPGGKKKTLPNGQLWTFPSRSQCMECHSIATGGTIGLETAQLNRDLVYEPENRISNELATLDHIGLFSTKLAGAPATLPRLPSPAGADPVDARARSYVHSNCAFCHRPGGSGQGKMDLRYQGTFAATGTCNAATTQGAVGGVSVIFTPGDPKNSVMSLRMHASDGTRMPPLAVSVPDPLGTALIDQWITGTATCP